MTDLEIMQHAKDYLDKLAKGIDPLTGREVPEGEIINNVRISRCLFYVADVLRQVIENGGIHPAKPVRAGDKADFALPFEDRSRYTFGDWPLSASHCDSYVFRHENWAIILATLIRQRNEICKYFLKVDSRQHSHQAKS